MIVDELVFRRMLNVLLLSDGPKENETIDISSH